MRHKEELNRYEINSRERFQLGYIDFPKKSINVLTSFLVRERLVLLLSKKKIKNSSNHCCDCSICRERMRHKEELNRYEINKFFSLEILFSYSL